MRIRHGNRQVADVTTLSTLASALLLATSRQWFRVVRGDEPPAGSQSIFVCSSGSRQLRVSANSSWQAVIVQAQHQNFTGDCSLYINVSTHVDETSTAVTQQQQQVRPIELLLNIDQVNVAIATDGTCDNSINSFTVYARNRSCNTGYICNISSAYIWSSGSTELYMYSITIHTSTPSFSVAFVLVAELINVCRSTSGYEELQIDKELYVFAPDSRYSQIPPNNVSCSNVNYTLTLLANSSSGGLRVAVLASQPSRSCCSLLLDGQHCSDSATRSFGPSNRFTLFYSCDDCIDDNNPGFTLRVAVEPVTTTHTSTTSEQLTATPTSTSSTESDTSTLFDTSSLLSSTRPLNSTVQSVSQSSLLSSRLLATFATEAAPVSSTNFLDDLISLKCCSPSGSPSSSPGASGSERNNAAFDVSISVAAGVCSSVGVALLITVSIVVAKRPHWLKCGVAGALQESGHVRQTGTAPFSQLSIPIISNSLPDEKALENDAADPHFAMVDNDLYGAT